jgi:O-antigen/teichoic acid export membrane protein
MSRVRNSLYASFLENYTITFLQFVSSIIIARILTPADIGIFSIAVLFSGLAHTVRDFGVTQYLIQERELTDDKIRAAMALSMGVAWLLALILLLLSGPIASFYREPGVSSAVIVLALNFVLIPFGSVVMALLRRALDYWAIFKIRVGSTLVNTIASVVLVVQGFGYMSLAWSALGGVVATVLLCGLYRPSGLPRLPSMKRVPQVFSFSGRVVVTRVLAELSRGVPELAVGRAQGMEAVGFLGRALGLLSMLDRVLMSALGSVTLPYFSKLEREGGDLKTNYVRAQAYVTGIAWPLLAFIAIAAGPIIGLLYGPQWGPSVPLVRVLCVAGVLASALPFLGEVLLSQGRADKHLKVQSLCATFRVAIVIVIVTATATAPTGLLAVCVGMVTSAAFDLLVNYAFLRRAATLTWRDLVDGSSRSLAVMTLSGIGPAWIGFMGERLALTSFLAVLLASLTAALGWLAGLYLFRHPVRDELAVVARRLRSRGTRQD